MSKYFHYFVLHLWIQMDRHEYVLSFHSETSLVFLNRKRQKSFFAFTFDGKIPSLFDLYVHLLQYYIRIYHCLQIVLFFYMHCCRFILNKFDDDYYFLKTRASIIKSLWWNMLLIFILHHLIISLCQSTAGWRPFLFPFCSIFCSFAPINLTISSLNRLCGLFFGIISLYPIQNFSCPSVIIYSGKAFCPIPF